MGNSFYFAYQKGLNGAEPVKFDSDILRPKNCLIVYKLNDDEAQMDLTDLVVKYPYKELPEL